ncbi:MAG TPA: ATP-dependent Clp protease ATP-binding subunit ClpX, partial [Clostridiales bacterium]|nr:ATP-dependent Clp protease ATP-binding subunit ClpX [Clostridiales bacterium]
KSIVKRIHSSAIGFGADVATKKEQMHNVFRKAVPQDLVKFGLVPELVGRLPIMAVLDELDEGALIKILTEPKNALIKQYKKLFSFDNIELIIDDDALIEIAKKAILQKTGARGLRTILEEILMDVMFDAPSDENIKSVTITADSVLNKAKPVITRKKKRVARSS